MVHAPSAEMVTPDSMGGLWHPVQEHSVHWGAPHSQCGYRQEKAGAGLGALDAIPSFPPQPAQGVLHLGSKRRALNPKALTVGICQNRCPTCWRQPVPLKVGCVVTTRRVATRGRVAGRARRGPPAAVPFRSVPCRERADRPGKQPSHCASRPPRRGPGSTGKAGQRRAALQWAAGGRAGRPAPARVPITAGSAASRIRQAEPSQGGAAGARTCCPPEPRIGAYPRGQSPAPRGGRGAVCRGAAVRGALSFVRQRWADGQQLDSHGGCSAVSSSRGEGGGFSGILGRSWLGREWEAVLFPEALP